INLSHITKTGAARSLVVLGAALASAVLVPHSQAQQNNKPPSSIGSPFPTAQISCHRITTLPMTPHPQQTLPRRLIANLPCGQEVSVLSDFEGYTVAVRTPEGTNGFVARIYLAAPSKAPSRPAIAAVSAEVKAGVASWQSGAPGCEQFSSE